MSEWLNSDSLWKAVPVLLTAIGTIKSWRNRWKGPRGILEFFDRRIHPEAENARLRYDNFRKDTEIRFLKKQLASRDTQLDQLMTLADEQGETASLLESSVASASEEIKSILPPLPVTTNSPTRSRKPKPNLFTPKK